MHLYEKAVYKVVSPYQFQWLQQECFCICQNEITITKYVDQVVIQLKRPYKICIPFTDVENKRGKPKTF